MIPENWEFVVRWFASIVEGEAFSVVELVWVVVATNSGSCIEMAECKEGSALYGAGWDLII